MLAVTPCTVEDRFLGVDGTACKVQPGEQKLQYCHTVMLSLHRASAVTQYLSGCQADQEP